MRYPIDDGNDDDDDDDDDDDGVFPFKRRFTHRHVMFLNWFLSICIYICSGQRNEQHISIILGLSCVLSTWKLHQNEVDPVFLLFATLVFKLRDYCIQIISSTTNNERHVN